MNLRTTFGKNVKYYRFQSKYTQVKLAEELDLDETTISNKLNSNTFFTQKEILKICSILNIAKDKIPEYFFKEKVREHEQK